MKFQAYHPCQFKFVKILFLYIYIYKRQQSLIWNAPNRPVRYFLFEIFNFITSIFPPILHMPNIFLQICLDISKQQVKLVNLLRSLLTSSSTLYLLSTNRQDQLVRSCSQYLNFHFEKHTAESFLRYVSFAGSLYLNSNLIFWCNHMVIWKLLLFYDC